MSPKFTLSIVNSLNNAENCLKTLFFGHPILSNQKTDGQFFGPLEVWDEVKLIKGMLRADSAAPTN